MFMWNERPSGRSSGWDPVRLHESRGFNRAEINRSKELVERNEFRLLGAWDEFFGE